MKRVAAERGQTISAIVDEFLADGVRRASAPKKRTFMLPIFNMGAPKIDINDREQLYDVMERG